MKTYFAPAEKAKENELQRQIEIVSKNSVIDGVMTVVGGLLAVLNECRQILAVNDVLLKMLGIKDAGKVFGLRPGEAIKCIHAYDLPGGCGTSKFCSTCGAAIAIVTSLVVDKIVERTCAMTVKSNGENKDLFFKVRAFPITLEASKLILLFLQDITDEHRWTALERTFFHDINNLISGLIGASELLMLENENDNNELPKQIHQLSKRLREEVAIHSLLSYTKVGNYKIIPKKVSLTKILDEIHELFSHHPVANNKILILPDTVPPLYINTDVSLVIRIITNMLTNAFEASKDKDEVKLWVEEGKGNITFCVWNKQVIAEIIARRIFQRHFSTKKGKGRGLGTYSMKLLGEDLLKGNVSFTTSEKEGTVFRFTLSTSRN